ncbi:hypothetical protein BK139_18670 [Paenibacillus sp. FSL R5-0490]|nr:hypothetical protein BK139_18670 [Paenibacillus sp. FSL R5-0490]
MQQTRGTYLESSFGPWTANLEKIQPFFSIFSYNEEEPRGGADKQKVRMSEYYIKHFFVLRGLINE